HVPVEERQQQRPDVAAVDVGVAHYDYLVVPGLLRVEVLLYARAQRGHERLQLDVLEDLLVARLLDVEYLALQGKYRLYVLVPPLLARPARALPLHYEDLRPL